MSKQSIYVKHKDVIFLEYKRVVQAIIKLEHWQSEDEIKRHLTYGRKRALEWVLGIDDDNIDFDLVYIDETQEEKEKEFSDKIDALTNKGENNEKENTKE
tara:strand:- start:466 stop:765 length:300 start_codon:yes stop_codon:yes gene_type:complete